MSSAATFHERTRGARKLIVVDFGFLGDSLQLIPSLWEIRRHHPDAALHILSSPLGAEVFRLSPCVDRVWPLEIHPRRRKLREQWAMIRALRHETFDVTFNFSGTDRPTLFTALIGARWRAAYPSHRMHFWSRWLIRDWVEARDPGIPIWKRHYQTLASLGFSLASPRFELRVDESTAAAAALSVPPGAVHLSINSANPLKEWPLGHYAQLVRIVWESCPEQNFLVSAAASEREQDRLRKFLALVDDGRLRAFPGHPDIAQLAAVLQRCRLHVGPDSGVVHLAVAMGVPTISLFREQNEYKCWLPQGPAHRYFTVPCSCVDHFSGPCNAMGHAVCLAKIVPAQVAALILENGARLCTA